MHAIFLVLFVLVKGQLVADSRPMPSMEVCQQELPKFAAKLPRHAELACVPVRVAEMEQG